MGLATIRRTERFVDDQRRPTFNAGDFGPLSGSTIALPQYGNELRS
jgi:hypothetical protein